MKLNISQVTEDSDKPRHRIPCPLDPSHTVFEDALPKHLKKCNVAKKLKPPCYSAHINTGLLDYQPSEEEGLPLSAFSMERVDELVRRIEAAYQGKYCNNLTLQRKSHFVLNLQNTSQRSRHRSFVILPWRVPFLIPRMGPQL